MLNVLGSEQISGPQIVPAGVTAQVPPPLQAPVWPQIPPDALHSLSGSWPDGTGAQVPGLDRLQEKQVPLHDELQQTPSTQNPLMHWLLCVHASPFCSCGGGQVTFEMSPAT